MAQEVVFVSAAIGLIVIGLIIYFVQRTGMLISERISHIKNNSVSVGCSYHLIL